jgi:hypothetical protein
MGVFVSNDLGAYEINSGVDWRFLMIIVIGIENRIN